MKTIRYCENCGDLLQLPYRRWCGKPECRKAADTERRRQSKEDCKAVKYWQLHRNKDKPKDHPKRFCQYPPDSKKKCGKPLKGTANMFFCPYHAKKIHWLIGVEEGWE